VTIVEFLTNRYQQEEDAWLQPVAAPAMAILAGFAMAGFAMADLASKRAIVAEYERIALSAETYPNPPNFSSLIAMTTVVRHLAQPYAGHPDYDPAWGVS